jgi:hypothetical protein
VKNGDREAFEVIALLVVAQGIGALGVLLLAAWVGGAL